MDMSNLNGLLDLTPQDQQGAINMGLLQAGLGILAHNTDRNNPMPAIGAGGLQGLQGYQQQLDRLQKKKLLDIQTMHIAQQNEADRLMMNALRKASSPADPTSALAQGAAVGDIGPTVTNAARVPVQAPPVSAGKIMLNAAIAAGNPTAVKQALAILKAEKDAADKWSTTPQVVMGPDGKTMLVQASEQGAIRPVTGYAPASKLHFADTGSGIQGLNEYTGAAVGNALPKSMSPYESSMLPIHQGQLKVARGNLAVNQGQLANSNLNTFFSTGMTPGAASGGGTATSAAVSPQPAAPQVTVPRPAPQAPPAMQPSVVTPKVRAQWEAEKPQATTSYEMKTQATDRLINEADALLNHKYLNWATGATAASSYIPGTPMYDVGAKLSALKSQISIAALTQMREASKTGGALGQVSNYEDQMLANSVAALQQAQTLPAVKDSLKEIKKWAQQAKDRTSTQYKTMYGNLPSSGASDGWSVEK